MSWNESDAKIISDRLDMEAFRLSINVRKCNEDMRFQPVFRREVNDNVFCATSGFVVDVRSPTLRDVLTRLPGGRALRDWNRARRQRRRAAREARLKPADPLLNVPDAPSAFERELEALRLGQDGAWVSVEAGVLRDLNERMLQLEQALAAIRRELLLKAHAGAEPVDENRFDSFHIAFADEFRGGRAGAAARLAPYLPLMHAAGLAGHSRPVLDLGCGRGEWLELLDRDGFTAYGIDVNASMVSIACSCGLDARCADFRTHLHGLQDKSISAITAFHLVEHLALPELLDLLDEVLRVLIPGGVFLLETPNPESILVGASSFHEDRTRHAPIPPDVLRFMLQQRGFAAVEIIRLHPFPPSEQLRGLDVDMSRLNLLLFGPQDYAIVARRP